MATLGSTGEQARATQQGVATIWDSGLVAKYLGSPNGTQVIKLQFKVTEVLASSNWADLPITSVLGLPLQYLVLPSNEAFHVMQADRVIHQGDPHRGEENETLTTLSMDIDFESPLFARPLARAYCDLLIKRLDGQDIGPETLEVVQCFVDSRDKFYNLCIDGKMDEARKAFEKIFNKKEFVMFFRDYRGKAVKLSNYAWAKVACPVALDEKICEFCGKESKELLACGKCKVAVYCGKDCQMEDWAVHKRLCKHMNNAR